MQQGMQDTAPRHAIPTRGEMQRHADDLKHGMRKDLQRLVLRCPERPEPKVLVRDAENVSFAMGDTNIFAALIAAALEAPADAVRGFAHQFYVRLMTFRRDQRPLPDFATLWLADTKTESASNIADHEFEHALHVGDVVTLTRCVELKAAELLAGEQMLQYMQAGLASVERSRARTGYAS